MVQSHTYDLYNDHRIVVSSLIFAFSSFVKIRFRQSRKDGQGVLVANPATAAALYSLSNFAVPSSVSLLF